MNVNLLLFGEAKLAIGAPTVELTLPTSACVGQLRIAIANQFPTLRELLTRSAVALNQQFADDTTVICEQDEIAWVPPVSGG